MKKLRFLSALLIITISASSQSTEDIQNILHLCFEHAEMNTEEHLNDAGIPVLVIVDNGVLPNDLSLMWFDNPVEYKTRQIVVDENVKAYIAFDSFTPNDSHAEAGFSYFRMKDNSAQHFILKFTKVGNNWINTSD